MQAQRGVGDGDVHVAECLGGLVHHRLHGGWIRDIGEHRERVRAEATRLRRDSIDRGLVTMAIHHHVRS